MGLAIVAIGAMAARVAAQPAPAHREGIVTIKNAFAGGATLLGSYAEFASSPLLGAIVGSDGPCTVYKPGRAGGLAVGTIAIAGTSQPITLEQSAPGSAIYKGASAAGSPSFADGAAITVQSSGGADLPPFTAAVTAPATLEGYTPPTSLARTGFTATWTAGSSDAIEIRISADGRNKQTVLVVCRVEDTGVFTVPASTFALISAAADRAVLVVSRIAETVQTVADARVAVDVVSAVGSGPYTLSQPASESGATTRDGVGAAPLPVRCETSPRRFLSVSFGIDGVSRIGDVPPMYGYSLGLRFGQRLAHRLYLVEEMNVLAGQEYLSPFPTDTSEEHIAFGVGLRRMLSEPRLVLNPAHFPGPYLDMGALYVTALLGADLRDRLTWVSPTQSTDQSALSPMTSVALGALAIQGRDWSLGAELRGQLAYFDGHLQRSWMVMWVAELQQW